MAADSATEVESLFEKLHQHISQGSDSRVLKVAEQILKAAPGDADALACKAVAHLQQQEYGAADRVLQHKALQGGMAFERAYCCYRLGRFEEALELLPAALEQRGPTSTQQLAAQVYFRLDRGQECAAAYDSLRDAGEVSTLEQKTNFIAAYVSAGRAASLPQLMSALGVKPRDSFEIGFNRAAGLAALGELEAAEAAVKAAYKQGEEALLDEELTEEEVLGELAPLTVLLSFILICTTRSGAAVDRLQPLIAGELPQREVAALAANNWAVACFNTDHQAKGFFGRSIRKLESLLDKQGGSGGAGGNSSGSVASAAASLALDPDLSSRLSSEQHQLLHLNRALLYYLSGKLDQARVLARLLAAAYPGNASVTMLQAVLLAKAGKAAEADALLASFKPSPGGAAAAGTGAGAAAAAVEAARPALLRAQLALDEGNVASALELLSAGLPAELASRPAVVATRVALLEQTGDVAGAEAALQAALKHWQAAAAAKPREPAAAAAGVSWCLQRLVSLKVAQGAMSEAMSLYLQLSKQGPAAGSTSSAALARLARAAAAAGDEAAVAALQQQLPAAYANLGSQLDVDALEASARLAAGSSSSRRRAADADAAAAGGGSSRKRDADDDAGAVGADGQPAKKRAKRKRKPRYPKGYDPSKPNGGLPPPDPERWLPKWQRSDAKKKAKRRRDRTETVKGSQGAGKVDEALDRAAKAERGEDDKTAKAAAAAAKPALPAGKSARGRGGRR